MELKHGDSKSDGNFAMYRQISMVRAMCGAQLKDRKTATVLMLVLGMNETTDQLAMANSVHWYGHVLR